MLRALTCIALLAPAAAFAHSAGIDTTVGVVGSVSGGRSTYVGLNLLGAADVLKDRLTLDIGYSLFKDEGSSVRHLLMAGAEYLPNDYWNVGVMVIGSPRRRSVYPIPLNIPERRRPGMPMEEPDLVATDWNLGAMVMGGYDTFGESNFETAVDGWVGATHYAIDQRGRVETAEGVIVQDFSDSVQQLRLGASVTETLFLDTDVNLRGNVYLYSEDPTKVGIIGRASQPLGVGVPLAPLRLDLRLGANHRFSRHFSAGVGVGMGTYVDDQGRQRLATAKVSLRPAKDLRIFLSATFQRDLIPRVTEPGADNFDSAFTNAGVEVRF